jgi:hypothetical protein
MKTQIVAASIVVDVALFAALLWMRAEHQGELREVALAAMRGDEIHLELHAASLAALASPGSEKSVATADMLRTVLAAGGKNIEARHRAGLGK